MMQVSEVGWGIRGVPGLEEGINEKTKKVGEGEWEKLQSSRESWVSLLVEGYPKNMKLRDDCTESKKPFFYIFDSVRQLETFFSAKS